ncbi:hypothetical protein BX666DRAFT_2032251 [Dichotomocladium elegans]|nr:hypothetical protein BX666DRAFT_2032251 [Dichotomocladium elegans]
MTHDDGASINELVLAACRSDQLETLESAMEDDSFDPNFVDGVGNTAAHYAAKNGSIDCLEALVNIDNINLDIKNRIEGDTPLHNAVRYQTEHVEMAVAMVQLLLEGGADPEGANYNKSDAFSIKNRDQLKPIDLVIPKYTDLKEILEHGVIANQFDEDDIVDEDEFAAAEHADYDSDDAHSD